MGPLSLIAGLIAYFSMVLISLLMLTGIARELEQKRPSLINKRWERILWLISCLLFIPALSTAVRIPSFVLGELREFIASGNNEGKGDKYGK